MNNVKLAIVGCGSISQLNVPGYLEHESCQIVALCDPVRERAEFRAAQWGITPRIYTKYDEVLDDSDIDAVELLTPTSLHAEQSIAALETGKHVSCQKPICNTLEEAERVALAMRHSGTCFRVTENFLYYPPLLKAKALLDSGAIGEPSFTRIHTLRGSHTIDRSFIEEPEARVWRRDSQANAGGQVFDGGWHNYATAMWLLGDDVEKISAVITHTSDFALEVPSTITWKFKGRDSLAVFGFGYAQRMPVRGKYYPLDDFFEIQGSEGVIWVTRCTGEMLELPPVVLHRGGESTSFQVASDWALGFKGAARSFVDCLINGDQPDMDVEFSMKVLRATMAAYLSSETGTSVEPTRLTRTSQ